MIRKSVRTMVISEFSKYFKSITQKYNIRVSNHTNCDFSIRFCRYVNRPKKEFGSRVLMKIMDDYSVEFKDVRYDYGGGNFYWEIRRHDPNKIAGGSTITVFDFKVKNQTYNFKNFKDLYNSIKSEINKFEIAKKHFSKDKLKWLILLKKI